MKGYFVYIVEIKIRVSVVNAILVVVNAKEFSINYISIYSNQFRVSTMQKSKSATVIFASVITNIHNKIISSYFGNTTSFKAIHNLDGDAHRSENISKFVNIRI